MMESHDHDRPISRRQLLKGSLALGAAVAVPGVLAACGGDEGSSDSSPAPTGATSTVAEGVPQSGGSLRVFNSIPSADSFDPQNFVASGDKIRAFNVCERLAMVNPDGTIKLHLAETVEPVSEDATAWRVTLRSGITHSNGKPLTTADVLWTFQRIAKPGAPYEATFVPFVDLDRTKAVDDLTIEFALKRPVGDFNRFLANEPFGILPDGSDTFEKPEDLIGTGPFKVIEWAPGERYRMVRNETYWEDGKPYLDEIEILNVNPDIDQAGALLAGQVDGTSGLEEAETRQLENDPSVVLTVTPAVRNPTWYMRLDSDAFQDVRVRQAFRLAIDRQQCLDVQFGGRGEIGNDLHGSLFPSFNGDLPQREYDPEQARSLLRQAGREGMEIELVTAAYADAATAYAEQAKAAGLNIRVNRVPVEDIYNTDLYYLKVPFGETNWTPAFEEMAPQGLLADAFYNETAWKRPAWDERFLEGYGTIDDEARYGIYKELQEELWQEGGWTVWSYAEVATAAATYVHGVIPWGTVSWWNGLRFEDIWRDA